MSWLPLDPSPRPPLIRQSQVVVPGQLQCYVPLEWEEEGVEGPQGDPPTSP